MSAVELAVEKVKGLSEDEARQLLSWLRTLRQKEEPLRGAIGAQAVRGFVRRYRPQPRSTSDWMKELREGEQ